MSEFEGELLGLGLSDLVEQRLIKRDLEKNMLTWKNNNKTRSGKKASDRDLWRDVHDPLRYDEPDGVGLRGQERGQPRPVGIGAAAQQEGGHGAAQRTHLRKKNINFV